MKKVYAIIHPETQVVRHIGVADDPEWAVRVRHKYKLELREWLDDLHEDPIIRVLEECADDPALYYKRRMAWMRQLAVGMFAAAASSEPPAAPPPAPMLPVEIEYEPEPVRVAVPQIAVTTAIRLRTELLTYAAIAERLTRLGQPPGHEWTPGETRHLIARAFYS